MVKMKLVAIGNKSRNVEDEVHDATDLIEAARRVDVNCGADGLKPRYELVDHGDLREDHDHGYIFYSVPVDFDIDDGSNPSDAEGAELVGAVRATYQL